MSDLSRLDPEELAYRLRQQRILAWDDFKPVSSGGSLGMRIIKSLARQMNADLIIKPTSPGTSFSLLVPLGTRPATD